MCKLTTTCCLWDHIEDYQGLSEILNLGHTAKLPLALKCTSVTVTPSSLGKTLHDKQPQKLTHVCSCHPA